MALLGISGVLITGAICVAALNYASLVQRDSNDSEQFKEQVSSLMQSFLEARQIAGDFLRKPSETSVKRYAESYERQLADLARVEAFVTGLPDDSPLKQATSLRAAVNLYATRFQNVVQAQRNLGFNEDDGFQGKLRTAVHTVEQQLSELHQPQLTILMLLMRRHEKDFILRNEDKYGDQLTEREGQFETELAQAGLPAEVKSRILELIRAYKSSFVSFMVTQQALNDQVEDLGQIYDRLRPALTKVVATADAHSRAAEMRAEDIRRKLIWVIGLATMCVGLLALWFGRRIARTVASMTAAMRQLGDGRFDVVLPGLGRKDELGEMAGAVEMFKLKAAERAQTELDAKAERDRATAEERKADIARLADSFEAAVGEIVETVSSASTELEASASTLTTTAERTEELTSMVATASEDASSNVQSVASATEELSSSIIEISRQVHESARIAGDAVGQAHTTTERVSELSKAAARIGDVVELISTIASQTNLLALNAAIEAARAGNAGRGFAVVASEVKALAEQTTRATGEIGQQISGIQTATREAAGAINEIFDTIGRLSEISSAIAAAIEEQGAATQEISRNVQRTVQRTQQVSLNIVDVKHGAEQTGSASSRVLTAAQSLSSESNRLKLEVGRFLSTVTAA